MIESIEELCTKLPKDIGHFWPGHSYLYSSEASRRSLDAPVFLMALLATCRYFEVVFKSL